MPRYIEDEEYEEEFEDEVPPPRDIRKGHTRATPASITRSISAILGGLLLIIAAAGFIWYITPRQSSSLLSALPIFAPTHPSTEQVSPLLAAGITLGHPTQAPTINQ